MGAGVTTVALFNAVQDAYALPSFNFQSLSPKPRDPYKIQTYNTTIITWKNLL